MRLPRALIPAIAFSVTFTALAQPRWPIALAVGIVAGWLAAEWAYPRKRRRK